MDEQTPATTPDAQIGLGLPPAVRACLFDMDGVLTQTATIHAAAWKEMFDGYLQGLAQRTGEAFTPFDIGADYGTYVDGKPRADGTRAFLESRGITLAAGQPDDRPGTETIAGLGNLKNEIVLRRIEQDGVTVYDGSIRYVRAARAAGLRCAVVTSSANAQALLRSADITDLFDVCVDGVAIAERHIPGKPAPDTFLAAAHSLGVEAAEAAVFEDALAGVQAGRAGRFALVVGVDRVGHADALRAHGADVVVADLDELLTSP
ncbi:MAG: beta-phosphoglucomutase family hydrolase [Candidatus Dormibacteraeota bacterium]|uniref:Beta-phosphoglucomutase n=1 Tax=Candidatus Amunia macphersoniae TaxID=3127014 RepID=A0A934NFJ8_9BACT|nr:beta-phosphoglucomutase family hydrolase [Candidatus Dormibacteraeota bacterium]